MFPPTSSIQKVLKGNFFKVLEKPQLFRGSFHDQSVHFTRAKLSEGDSTSDSKEKNSQPSSRAFLCVKHKLAWNQELRFGRSHVLRPLAGDDAQVSETFVSRQGNPPPLERSVFAGVNCLLLGVRFVLEFVAQERLLGAGGHHADLVLVIVVVLP